MNLGTTWTIGSAVTLVVGVIATIGLYGVLVWVHTKERGE